MPSKILRLRLRAALTALPAGVQPSVASGAPGIVWKPVPAGSQIASQSGTARVPLRVNGGGVQVAVQSGTATIASVVTPTTIAYSQGDAQSAPVNTAVPINPRVLVTGQGGNPAANVTVTWTVTGGGGNVSPGTSLTDASGLASTVWTMGSNPGANSMQASVAGLAGSPVSFTATAVASGAFTDDGFYIATHEPTDANTVLAEDFTRGAWYTKNCDDANASGGLGQTGVHGWCGNIFVEINPAGGVRNNFQGVGGKQYCGTSGNLGAVGMMADHSLKVASAEIWCRFYTKALAGYNWGAEKVLTINNGPAGVGGIWGGNIHVNCGTGGGTGQDGFMQWQGVGAPSCLGVLDVTAGNWYYVELHFNTAGRILQIWADNCGTNGLSPPAQPTLRLNQSGYAWMPSSGTVGSIWLEHWSNPGSSGERLWDYIKVQRGSRAGPIGFFTLA